MRRALCRSACCRLSWLADRGGLQEPLPAKLLNNAAVLFMRTGRATAALELLEEAFQVWARAPGACCNQAHLRGSRRLHPLTHGFLSTDCEQRAQERLAWCPHSSRLGTPGTSGITAQALGLADSTTHSQILGWCRQPKARLAGQACPHSARSRWATTAHASRRHAASFWQPPTRTRAFWPSSQVCACVRPSAKQPVLQRAGC